MVKIKLYLRMFSNFLFQSSENKSYLNLLSQSKAIKTQRLMDDKSNIIINKYKTFLHEDSFFLNLLNKLPLWDPTSRIALGWYVVVFAAILYYYVEMGLALTYQNVWQQQMANGLFIFFDLLAILVLIIDIIARFCLGFIYKGMIVINRIRIAHKYLKGSFILDLISVLILLISVISKSYGTNWAKLWTLFYFLRLSIIDDCFLRRLNIHRTTKTFYVVFKLMIIIFILSHIVGLVFFAIDYHLYITQYYGSDTQWYWIVNANAEANIIQLHWSLQYLYSLYWGVNTITTISYGDIAPNNPIQVVYTTIMFFLAFMVYGYVVNQIVSIIMWARGHKDDYRQEVVIMENYMDKMNVNRQLKKKVRDYLQFIYKQGNMRDYNIESQMKQKLPSELRSALLKNAYSTFNIKIQTIFYERQQVSEFLLYLKEENFTYDEIIFQQARHSDNLYFLSRGFLYYELHLSKSGIMLYEVNIENSLFGQLQFFTQKIYPYTCKTKSPSLVYSLPYADMMNQINKNIKLRQTYHLVLKKIIHHNNYAIILHYCYFCYKEHDFRKCQERLPQFSVPDKLVIEQENKRQRTNRIRLCALKYKQKMQNNKKIHNTSRKLLERIQKRIIKIRQILNQKDRDFQVDTAHDWQIFQPNCNLLEVKAKVNKKKQPKITQFLLQNSKL